MKIKIRLATKVPRTFVGWRWNEHRSCQYDADRPLLLFLFSSNRLKTSTGAFQSSNQVNNA